MIILKLDKDHIFFQKRKIKKKSYNKLFGNRKMCIFFFFLIECATLN